MTTKEKFILLISTIAILAAIIFVIAKADTIDGNSMLVEIVKANGGCK